MGVCLFVIESNGLSDLDIGSVFLFPLKSCSTDNQILFVIDCRDEVREQTYFINQTVDYLRYNRNWTLVNVSYMTYEDKEPTSLEVLTANITEKANEILNQCYGTISVNDLFLKTNLTAGMKHSILKLSVIFLNIDNGKMELTREIAGLVKKPWEESFWSSGNPFTFYHNLEQQETPQCLYLMYNTNISDTSTFKNSKSIWRYLNMIDCNQIINETYIVFPCKSYGGSSFKCLKIDYSCKDNSHLENCEHFQCPDGFIKCPHSYCIPLIYLEHVDRNCPLGEEKNLFARSRRICSAKISLKIKDICIHTKYLEKYLEARLSYICNENNCSPGYSCMSYKFKDNLTRFVQQNTDLYNVSNSLLPFVDSYLYFPYLQIVEIKVKNCKIQNFDKSLRQWEKTQTVILDLSRNQISNSDDLRSVTSMTTLLYLNLSRNVQLSINGKFEFPYTLEVIDLSYTSVESLPERIFEVLHSLRMLDLSYTKIHKFENMGLPRYFKLDILNIVGVMMTEITADFYKGLTVNTSLMSSDFKLCCPQILGKNIPSGKCHAPDDAISSCKHVIGDTLKRILVWVVGLLTIAGNGIVLFYRVVWNREKIFQTAYGLFVTGLAVSDLLMGVYLMIIAVVDVVYADVYVVYDESWRKSFLCNFSGFLSTLSSETSTFLIGLITLDRFISISYPFSAQETSKSLKWKGFISTWVIGFVVALTPAVVPEWQIYSSNGLCLALPLSTTGSYKLPGWEFSMAVYVILNFVLFLFIALGQLGIFVNVIKTRNLPSMRHCSEKRTQDMNIAKKLAFVAVSDFLCWFPIGIMGILSLIGEEFDKETKVGHFSNSRVGLFSKQQGWPLQQTARLASSANSGVGLFSSSKVGLFSRRQGWPLQQTARLASSANSRVGLFSSSR
ncbi:hypothetical protein Btru_008364, partial [Bulinus truncatus]